MESPSWVTVGVVVNIQKTDVRTVGGLELLDYLTTLFRRSFFVFLYKFLFGRNFGVYYILLLDVSL